MRLRKGGLVPGAVVALVLMAIASPLQVGARITPSASPAVPASIQRGFINLDGSPGTPAVNPRTDTLYVPVQCPIGCPPAPLTHEMDLINTSTCNSVITTDCHVVARARVGDSPLAAAVDEKTDTIYVANGTGSVSVVNGSTCNATVTSGCSTPVATIDTGGFPVDDVFNPMTRTLYVASPAPGSVFVIDGASCNALTTSGCGKPVKTVTDTFGPQALDVDVATDTIYTADNDSGGGSTVSVIDGATCNGSTGSGCGSAPHTVTVGSGSFWDAVDQETNTIYVASNNVNTVAVINGARCNGEITVGCSSAPPTVSVGGGPVSVAVDDRLHTVFALNGSDDTLSAINTHTCKGTVTSGCSTTTPAAQAGSNHNPGYTANPNTITLLPGTDTAYLVTVGGENRASVITLGRCNAVTTSGCLKVAPSAPDPEYEVSVDPATNTIYATNLNLPEIDVIKGATCDAKHVAGCAPVAEIPMVSPDDLMGAIDDADHTLYVSDRSGIVVAVNIATCNAAHTAGCAAPAATITVGPGPLPPALNPATQSLYVPFGTNSNELAVMNAATCNAEVTSGCGQTPSVVAISENTAAVAVSVKQDTIYATNVGNPFASGDTVDVVNGATCNGTDHSGCGSLAATLTVGAGPFGVGVDDATNTVYVANNTNGDTPGTVSVINSATCNGHDTAGCAGPFPTVVIGRSPLILAVDIRTDTIYVADYSSAGVSVINGSTCNAEVTSGCGRPAPEQAVGSQPFGVAVNQETNTVYATDLSAGSLSILKGRS
ncbi:MAG: YncE family protein [Candidatus Dormiibacterota bacterium]